MNLQSLVIVLLSLTLASCAYVSKQGTIAELDSVNIEIKDTEIEGGLDKAMQAYQKFLEQTPESALTPEALRRIADLKVEKEYGTLTDTTVVERESAQVVMADTPVASSEPRPGTKAVSPIEASSGKERAVVSAIASDESEKDFENRTTQQQHIQSAGGTKNLALPKGEAGADLQNANAQEAIGLYKKLLEKYPLYERNDQVLYQLSRAYEEIGQVDQAMQVMDRLIKQYPTSRYTDEVQFRRGEYYFTRKKYLDAEEAYGEVLKFGVGSVYYERALYKKGWTFYKQELYEESLHEFLTLLDYKVSKGYDFEQTEDNIERKRTSDTFRVISLSFSNLGGADSVQEYFSKYGSRSYEDNVYANLAEFFFTKRRYNDAATTYTTFIAANPFHKKSPHFNMRVVEIYQKGRFPRLVIGAKKQFASTYGLNAEYWSYFNQAEYPEVLGYLKTNLVDLANHYHAMYQNAKFKKDKPENFAEASHWYREFLKSFPRDEQSPGINYQLADLLLENKDYKLAALEYERSAYDYPFNDKSSKAAYAAVYAYREHLKTAPESQAQNVKREIIRTSLRLVDTFPQHEKATIVLGSAVDDLFKMRDFPLAIKTGHRLLTEYPAADPSIRRGTWMVVAHSSYEIEQFREAELAYIETLKLTAQNDKSREKIVDNLAASVYKQGEQAKAKEDYKTAVNHFLRIATIAPTSKIRPAAEYDAAAVLIQIMELEQASEVLLSFRKNYPGHELQHDVTKKIAFVYMELGKFGPAAQEFERVASESKDEELIREAMLTAAELYEQAPDTNNALRVYKQYVVQFPRPLEFTLETYHKIATIYKSRDELQNYRHTLQRIISMDAKAGSERTDRTRYLAAKASLIIIEPSFDEFIAIKLVKPFKANLTKKQKSMKSLVASYSKLVDYKVADVTAASTYYIAEIYFNFSRSLMESERPDNLNTIELEEFNLMLEEQAYPFEEKAIKVHEKNVELLASGLYSPWIDRSIDKLAKLLPARYAKPEESTNYVTNLHVFRYASQNQPFKAQVSELAADKTAQERKEINQGQDNPESLESVSVASQTSGASSTGDIRPASPQDAKTPIVQTPKSMETPGAPEETETDSISDSQSVVGKELQAEQDAGLERSIESESNNQVVSDGSDTSGSVDDQMASTSTGEQAQQGITE
jgi:tetratricopeptide (TPR) repeat protein